MSDDKDIKIYVKKDKNDTSELSRIAGEISLHKENGNYDKAVALGERLAHVSVRDVVLNLDELKLTASDLLQARILITFVAETALRSLVRDPFLSTVANNAMFEYFKTNENGFYKNVSDGAAFSFYIMALGKDGEITENIGRQFALRCASKKEVYADIGKSICSAAYAYVEDVISSVTFAGAES